MTSFDTIQKQLAEHLAELPIRNLADAGVDLKLTTMTEATKRPSEDAMEFDEIFQASNTLPWAVIQDEYGNAGIADSMGNWIVEQVESVEYADLIVKAVNNFLQDTSEQETE